MYSYSSNQDYITTIIRLYIATAVIRLCNHNNQTIQQLWSDYINIYYYYFFYIFLYFSHFAVTVPKPGPTPSSSSSSFSNPKPPRRSMPSPYRLLTALPQLPVRKGIRGRRPKSETIALLKAWPLHCIPGHRRSRRSHAHNHCPFPSIPCVHYKKRGPKPGSKVALKDICGIYEGLSH